MPRNKQTHPNCLITTDVRSSERSLQKKKASWKSNWNTSWMHGYTTEPPDLASFPGHSQILSRSRGERRCCVYVSSEFSPQLRDKIWEWPGNEATADPRQSLKWICFLKTWNRVVWNRVNEHPILRSSSMRASTERASFQLGAARLWKAWRIACSVMEENRAR